MSQLDQNFPPLDPVDRQLIDAEHARLEQFMCDLRDTCENFGANGDCYHCSKLQVATCQGRLTSFFYDFMDLIGEHIENEEKIMLHTLVATEEDPHFMAHQAEHERLIREVRELMRVASGFSAKGNPSESIRILYRKISEMFGEHARNFDSQVLGHQPH